MFEAGKKYKFVDGHIYECVASYEHTGWMLNLANKQQKAPFTYGWGQGWTEYKEPAIKTYYINMYKNTRTNRIVMGGVHENKKSAEDGIHWLVGESQKFLETTEFTYMEKQDA